MNDLKLMGTNRIIGYEMVEPDSLMPNEANFRLHPEYQLDTIKEVLDKLGWLDEVTVNLRTSKLWPKNQRNVKTVTDGHARVKVAQQYGISPIPVKYVDLTPEEERLALATYDAVTMQAEIDRMKLGELISQIAIEEGAIADMIAAMEPVRIDPDSAGLMEYLGDLTGEEDEEEDLTEEMENEDGVYVQLNFAVSDEERSKVLLAISQAKREFNVNTSTAALLGICAKYLDGSHG